MNGNELSSAEARSRGILSLRTFFGRKGGPTKLNPNPLSIDSEQCTATVVGPSWLITARHCIWPERLLSKLPNRAPEEWEPRPNRGNYYRVGSQIRLDAGMPSPAWSFTCDIALVNSTLNDRRRPGLPVFPPGPRRDAEEAAERGPRVPGGKRLQKPPADVCRVWLSAGEADIALISLPPAGRYPEATAGIAFFDRDVHSLLSPGKNVDVDIFGYSGVGTGKVALRSGEMRLLQPGFKSNAGTSDTEMPKGYAHFDPVPGTVPGPQFIAGGDSGGPSFLRGGGPARPLQVGVTSYNLPHSTIANPSGDQPPSFVVQPFAATEAMLLEWMEKRLAFTVAPPTPAPQPLTSQTFVMDWNGDGLTDVVTIDTTQTSIRLATPSGYAAPITRKYGYVAAFDVSIDVPRAIPARLRGPGGVVESAFVSIRDTGRLDVYTESAEGTDVYLFGNGHGTLPFGIADNRTANNTFVVHVSDPAKDEILLVDAFQTTLIRQDTPGHFDTNAEALVKTPIGKDDPYGLDFRLADVDGDGRTDFVHRTKEGVGVLLGQPSGQWGPEQFSPYGTSLPDTAGVRLVDLNGDARDDLVWLDRQPAPADARYVHVRLANSDKPNAKPQGKPGTFGPELVSPIEIGDGWTAKDAGAEPVGVGGYDFGDVTGDGVPDVANVGTFGTLSEGVMVRVAALFVKPGRGDGSFAELQVFRLPLASLSVKGEVAAGFALLPTRKAGRADPVFISNEVNGTLDVLVAK